MTSNEFFFYFLILVIQSLSQAGGSAGGGIIIPIALILYHFDTNTAIALSNCSLGAGGLIKNFYSL